MASFRFGKAQYVMKKNGAFVPKKFLYNNVMPNYVLAWFYIPDGINFGVLMDERCGISNGLYEFPLAHFVEMFEFINDFMCLWSHSTKVSKMDLI